MLCRARITPQQKLVIACRPHSVTHVTMAMQMFQAHQSKRSTQVLHSATEYTSR